MHPVNSPERPNDTGCYLPFGASCRPEEQACLTGNCDSSTLTCACNLVTNYPCNPCDDFYCVLNNDNQYTCQVAESGTGCNPQGAPGSNGGCVDENFDNQVSCGGCIFIGQCAATRVNPKIYRENVCGHANDVTSDTTRRISNCFSCNLSKQVDIYVHSIKCALASFMRHSRGAVVDFRQWWLALLVFERSHDSCTSIK